MKSRLLVVGLIFGLAYSFLLFNLYKLQIADGQIYSVKAETQNRLSDDYKIKRGLIYFTYKDGENFPVVLNKEFPVIFAVPKEIDDAAEVTNRLNLAIEGLPDNLGERLSQKEDQYELLVRKADSEMVKAINELGIKGVYVDFQPDRFYPFGDLGASVLGFVGQSNESGGISGKYGIESFYEDKLSGQSSKENTKDGELIVGENVILTIEPNIQKEAQRIISSLVDEYNASGGSVIVQEPSTGRILAMENYPSFDPNNYGRFNFGRFLNPLVQGIYEPGSVFKVITMAAGIDSGKISPETTYTDYGSLVISGRTIRNWDLKAHGVATMTNVLEGSINTGAVFAEQQTGNSIFKSYLENFGFNERSGIDLPGEVEGDLERLQSNAPEIAFATASFGQGVAVTPIEMINAFSTIANGGLMMRPYVNSELGPKEIRSVISSDTAKKVTQMMVSAVDKAQVGRVNGYSIAGKTGTAQIPDFNNGGYTDKVINTYIGFGPTADPKFVILIKLNEPAGAPLAGLTVVPAFRELAQFILNYYNIPPDRI